MFSRLEEKPAVQYVICLVAAIEALIAVSQAVQIFKAVL
jgi:hypothetical protein